MSGRSPVSWHPKRSRRGTALGSPVPGRGRSGQALAEFALVAPIILVLLLVVGDFARLFATGIAVESAARDAAEVAAQEYLRDPPSPTDPSFVPADYYTAIDTYAIDTACGELGGLPNAGSQCDAIPALVCVHDGADTNCQNVYPIGVAVPPQCRSFAAGQLPTNVQTGGSETSKYIEVRLCYRFSTLLNISNVGGIPVPFGDFYIERDRVFTVADY